MSIVEPAEVDRKVENLDALPLGELAARANAASKDVEFYAQTTVEHAILVGGLLLAAKSKVKHGEWAKWLDNHVEFSAYTAQRYMKLAKTARVRDLNSDSIRGALRKIAGPAPDSRESKDEEAVKKLLAGEQQADVAKTLELPNKQVSKLFHEQVKPEILAIDWVAICNQEAVKEIAAAENMLAISTEAKEYGGGGWLALASEKLGVTRGRLDAASVIVRKGCKLLIDRAKSGDIALTTAADIAQSPEKEQMQTLRDLKRKRVVAAFDELRSFVSTMVNQKFGWQQNHGDALSVFRDLAQGSNNDEDLRGIISNLKSVAEWAVAVARELESPDVHS